jgi:hypothetical protein
MSSSVVGAGPSGYDWLVGTWSCTNSMQPSKLGTFLLTNGSVTPIRDTYTMLGTTKQYDLSEAQVGGAWKTVAKTTCTRS